MGRVASETVRAMREASEVVLPGFSLRAEPGKAVTYPSRYSDPRGERTWSLVRRLLPP